jgi:hypothetical protein
MDRPMDSSPRTDQPASVELAGRAANAPPPPLSSTLAAPIKRGERRPVSLNGHAVLEDGTVTEIILVDLSYEGCGIECPIRLKRGAAIKLAIVKRGAISATVRWYKDGKAGLIFEPERQPEKEHLPRRHERIPLSAEVTVRRLGRFNYRVRVFDASAHGCKVEFVERPELQETLWVRFEGLEPIEARVCWLDGRSVGLQFSRPIHPAVFDLVAERLRQAP